MAAFSQDTPDPSMYDVFQKVFAVSLCSNVIIGSKGTADHLLEKLTKVLPPALEKAGEGWEVVWGPVVWKSDPNVSITSYGNIWFVAKNNHVVFDDGSTRCTYVVAIAGTSGIYDWIYEDAAIRKVVDLDAWAGQGAAAISKAPAPILNNDSVPSDKPLITNGFGQAVYQLLNNVPHNNYPGAGSKLPDFLKSIQPGSSLPFPPKLVFTGHSLGGALSPSLAYTLLRADCLGPFSKDMKDVHVYPTAGPTPGNATFSTEFTRYFPRRTISPESSYKHWNVNIINPFDVVPCAYCEDSAYIPEVLSSIVPMYGNKWTQILGVAAAVKILSKRAKKLYVPIASKCFACPIPKPPTAPVDSWDFIDAAHVYHVNAYTKEILGFIPPPKKHFEQKLDDWLTHPVLGFMANKQKEVEANGGKLPEGVIEYVDEEIGEA